METKLGSFRYSDGYHDCTTTYYMYCDRCGSFSIKEYRALKTWAEVAFGICLAVLGGIAIWYMSDLHFLIAFAACFILIFIVLDLFIIYIIYERGSKYRCRKCGNIDITGDNVLNYPEEDRSVIDVPDRLTCKHDDYTYA